MIITFPILLLFKYSVEAYIQSTLDNSKIKHQYKIESMNKRCLILYKEKHQNYVT